MAVHTDNRLDVVMYRVKEGIAWICSPSFDLGTAGFLCLQKLVAGLTILSREHL